MASASDAVVGFYDVLSGTNSFVKGYCTFETNGLVLKSFGVKYIWM